MTKIFLATAMAAALFSPAIAAAYSAQDVAPPAETTTQLTLPLVEGAAASPDCGGLYDLAGSAHCMTTPLSRLPAVANVYMGALPQAGWEHIDGGDNEVLFQHRRPDDQCDFLVMFAFYDVELPEEALSEAPGYLGFILRTEGPCQVSQLEDDEAPQP